jgi:uncharacterized protein YyaL (SSP411 family)
VSEPHSGKPNRLAAESSPYLLLHAHNPVDWYAWGDEAFEKARAEDKPIFLSVGYSTCYWCHVMERESFSDPEIAKQLNDAFVSIKLDREERPDLDEIYMTATQLLTESGGWPNSLFLTPEAKPFFAGTYFPPDDRHGRPGFARVLTAIREAWALRRAEVTQQAETLADAIRRQAGGGAAAGAPDPALADSLEAELERRFDRRHGGFGRAPKFPSPANLSFLLERARAGRHEARDMLVVTLDRMARGGIHDQIAGGFHRYSTDAEWLVPHFEKMLYDNAALAELYAEADALAPAEGFARVARATLDFVLREMTGPEGGFLSAIDAETDGHEGAYYTWTAADLEAALDPEARARLATLYGFGGSPNFERDRYVLHLPEPVDEALLAAAEAGRQRLLAVRSERKRPLTDDKVLADWNGMMIGAMATAGQRLPEPRYVAAAARAADFVLAELREDASGELRHVWRQGRAKVPGLLDDYAFLVAGLLALHEATGEERWLTEARRLQAEQDRRLWDAAELGYFNAGDDPRLLVRSKSAHDGAVSSATGIAALNLIALAARTGDAAYRTRGEELFRAVSEPMSRWPQAHATLVRALAAFGPAVAAPPVAAPAPGPLAAAARDVVTVVATLDRSAKGPWKPFALELTVAGGWHVNANPPLLRFLIATEVRSGHSEVRAVRYPKGERYEGRFRIEGEVHVEGAAPSVSLTYQPCDEEKCLTPVTRDIAFP